MSNEQTAHLLPDEREMLERANAATLSIFHEMGPDLLRRLAEYRQMCDVAGIERIGASQWQCAHFHEDGTKEMVPFHTWIWRRKQAAKDLADAIREIERLRAELDAERRGKTYRSECAGCLAVMPELERLRETLKNVVGAR